MDTDILLVKPVHPVSKTSQTTPSEIFQPTEVQLTRYELINY